MQGLDIRNSNLDIGNGEPVKARSIFTVVSLVCMMVLALLLGKCISQAIGFAATQRRHLQHITPGDAFGAYVCMSDSALIARDI
jgi:hypothetical protein